MLGDIISGAVEIGSLTASTVMGQIDGGKLRALAVGTDKRLDLLFQGADIQGAWLRHQPDRLDGDRRSRGHVSRDAAGA